MPCLIRYVQFIRSMHVAMRGLCARAGRQPSMDLDEGKVARRVQPNHKVQLVGRHVRGHGARSGMGNHPRQEGYDAELPHAVEPITGAGRGLSCSTATGQGRGNTREPHAT